MTIDLSDFWEEYGELTDRVIRARHEDFASFLRRWFSVLDEAPSTILATVRKLETMWTYERVEAEVMDPQEGTGSGRLLWPEKREERLSAQLALFRHLSRAENDNEGWQFSHDYYYTSSNRIDDILHEMTENLFEPFARELQRYLTRRISDPVEVNFIPASDRIVPLDHNSEIYGETIDSLKIVGEAIKGNNELDEIERDRLRFELEAGTLLMDAQTVRAEAVYELLIKCLKWLGEKFADQAVGIAAGAALSLLCRLVGLELPG